MDWIVSKFQQAKDAIAGTAQTVSEPIKSALPSVATDSGSAKMLGVPSETPGTTMTGGRRHRRKTRKGGKKSRKTRKH